LILTITLKDRGTELVENKSVISVVPMDKAHIDSVARLEELIFSVPFKKKDIEELYMNTSWRFFVALDGDTVVGYISLYLIIDEKEIVNVCVLPEHRGRGIGAMLVKCALEYERDKTARVMLEVRASNDGAISLYKKFGFLPVGVSKNHYSQPREDAVLMNLEY